MLINSYSHSNLKLLYLKLFVNEKSLVDKLKNMSILDKNPRNMCNTSYE